MIIASGASISLCLCPSDGYDKSRHRKPLRAVGHTEALETKRQQRRNDKDQIVSYKARKAINSTEGEKIDRTQSLYAVEHTEVLKNVRQQRNDKALSPV